MQKFVSLISFLFILSLPSSKLLGQEYYGSAFGIRAGTSFFVSYVNFIDESIAIDLGAGRFISNDFAQNFSYVTLLGKAHTPLPNAYFSWFYGAGFVGKFGRNEFRDYGFVGLIGLDCRFPQTPFVFSFEYSPFIFFEGQNFNEQYRVENPVNIGIYYVFY